MRARWLASLVVLVGSSLAVVVPPSPSHADTRTSTGARCTVVGTRGPDRLTGTAGRDVICGLGGNDRINGLGGNDIVDAGAGDDRVRGGAGKDRIYGGGGEDSLDGQGGADTLRGGSGADRLTGNSGNDRTYGDAGNDVQTGDAGDDVVTGDEGDDDLSGGPGGDDVDGGAGFNVCDEPSAANDTQVRCAVDGSAPVVAEVTATPSTVDVSEAARTVRLQAHVTDDTGVKRVQLATGLARLVSGTARDGVWAATIRVPRFIAPGPRDVDVFVHDRVGRTAFPTRPNVYTVINTVVDRQMPVVRSLSLSTTAVDVRSAARPITATVHLTDDLAGAADLYLCPAHAFPTGTPSFRQAGSCVSMRQVSGVPTDSSWAATYLVPQAAPSGTWNFAVWVNDAAGNSPNDFWLGPDQLAALQPTSEPRYRAIPDGAGVFTVLGTAQDANAPVLKSLTLTPSVLDTSTGAVQVTADIAGTDLEGITGAGLFISGYAGYPDNPNWIDLVQIAWVTTFHLQSGTPQDGVWRATFVVPGGTPNGTYFIQAALEDSAHFESWVSPDSGWTTNNHLLTPELAPTGTHLVIANS
jgi:Ca2+-binding RTX toxin-like protein